MPRQLTGAFIRTTQHEDILQIELFDHVLYNRFNGVAFFILTILQFAKSKMLQTRETKKKNKGKEVMKSLWKLSILFYFFNFNVELLVKAVSQFY